MVESSSCVHWRRTGRRERCHAVSRTALDLGDGRTVNLSGWGSFLFLSPQAAEFVTTREPLAGRSTMIDVQLARYYTRTTMYDRIGGHLSHGVRRTGLIEIS